MNSGTKAIILISIAMAMIGGIYFALIKPILDSPAPNVSSTDAAGNTVSSTDGFTQSVMNYSASKTSDNVGGAWMDYVISGNSQP